MNSSFETNPIRTNPKKFSWKKLSLGILAVFGTLLIVKGLSGAFYSGNFSVKQVFLSALGSGLKTDPEGLTNVLLIGVGGEGHDGENLTDTMIVASIDSFDNRVSMLSIPRDLFVRNKEVGWGGRINGIYETIYNKNEDELEAETALQNQLEDMLGVKIQYFVKIDFKGFTKLVDAIGGVDIDVKEALYDDRYPKGENGLTEVFSLPAGEQTLDGETALKYARSRHQTGDFSRAARQQQVIEAIREKTLSLGMLSHPDKLKNTISALANNIQTNFSLSEMLALAKVAQDVDSEKIHHAVINDAPNMTGGFLYTLPRELDTDPFYLSPYVGEGKFEELTRFTDILFHAPASQLQDVPILIRNGTAQNGLAGLTKMLLVRYGFKVLDYGNADSKTLTKTMLYQGANTSAPSTSLDGTLKGLNLLFDGQFQFNSPLPLLSEDPVQDTTSVQSSDSSAAENPAQALEATQSEPALVLDLGADFLEFYKAHKNLFYLGYY